MVFNDEKTRICFIVSKIRNLFPMVIILEKSAPQKNENSYLSHPAALLQWDSACKELLEAPSKSHQLDGPMTSCLSLWGLTTNY